MTSPGHIKYNVLITTIILALLSIFVIFYKFLEIPRTLTFDEIEFAKLALSLGTHGYVPYSPLATGHATLYFYFLLFSMKLFGVSTLGLRIPSALFGFFSIIVFFFVIRKSVRKMDIPNSSFLHTLLPIAGAFLFATTRWYFNFARFGFEGTCIMFFELTSLLFFLHYLDHRQKKWLVLTGIFTGLAYNSYQTGRIFFILPLLFLFLTILERHTKRLDFSFFTKQTATAFLAFLVPFIICIIPLSLYLSQNQDVRMYQLFYPANNEMSVGDKFQFLSRNVVSTTLMFGVKGDVNGRHNYPNKAALNPIVFGLFVFGLIFALFHLKNKMNQLYLLYFCFAVFPTLVTYPWENPNMLRTLTSIPSIIYLSVYAIGIFYKYIEQKFKIDYRIVMFGIFIVICISAIYDLRTYFIYQAPVFKEAFEASMPLSYYIEHTDAKTKK